MAVNPITSDDLTIDLRALMSIPVGDRVQAAASDPGFAQALMQSLTPIQIAKAFPDYYRRELPDISNFILANRYLDSGGAFDQRGGGTYGDQRDGYGGEATLDNTARPIGVPQPTVEEMKAKLLEKGIDVDKTFEVVGNGIAIDDPQVEFLKSVSAEKLTQMGFEQFDDEDGTKKIRLKPVEAEIMTDQQVLEVMAETSGKVVPGQIRDSNEQTSYYDKMYNAVYKAAVEKGVKNPEIIARLGATQTALETGYGKHMVGNNAFGVKADKGGGVTATTQEFINGKYVTIKDNFRTYANAEESAADYVQFLKDNKRYKEVLEADTIDEAIAAQGKTGYASDPRYEEKLYSINKLMSKGATSATINKDMSQILANATPEDIKNFRNDLKSKQKQQQFDNFVKTAYNLPSPTSSDYQLSGESLVNELGYSVPVTGKMLHEGHGATSEFGYGRGRLHAGVDIYSTNPETGELRVGSNAPVTAPSEGKVTMIMRDRGKAGNYIEIQDKNGYRHRFLHTAKDPAINPSTGEAWKVGDTVSQGQTVTHITGSGTKFDQKVSELGGNINAAVQYFDQNGWGSVNKPHLHYEVRDNSGRLMNPEVIFPEYSGEDKEKITFANKDDKLKHMLVTGQISKEDYEKQKTISQPMVEETKATPLPDTPDTTVEKKQKPLSIISYSRPEENIRKKENVQEATETTTAEQPIQKFQYGGTPDVQDDEDLTAVGSDGKPKFKFNSGEGLYVKPEANEYADEKISELSDRVDKMSEPQQAPKQREMTTSGPAPDTRWAEKVASAYRPSGTQQRAFNRAQFRSEGKHVGDRGSPNIA